MTSPDQPESPDRPSSPDLTAEPPLEVEEEEVEGEEEEAQDPAQDFGGDLDEGPAAGSLTVGDTGERPPEHLEPEPAEILPELAGVTESGEPAEIDPRQLDPDAVKVVHRLRAHGHEAYLVGGCVRDLLVGKQPKDFDVATSAHPEEVRQLFRNCRLIGRRFRLAHVYFRGGKVVEVSTFRRNPTDVAAEGAVDAELASHDSGVEEDLLITADNVFGTAEEDARRRDFTINGLFYDVGAGKVIDFVRGRRDLDRRLVRTIGDPEVRMREDPVRMIRAVRFASKLDFDIDSRTYAAMEGAVEELPRCAPPRLLEDTFRVLRGGISENALRLLSALDALKVLLPPVAEYLAKGGAEAEAEFYAHARALDDNQKTGTAWEDAMLLAVLLLPLSQAAPPPADAPGGRPNVGQVVENLLAELVRSARLPRRIAERCRMILFAQRTLNGERRRRGSLSSFRKHPLFGEAMAVFEISVAATGRHRDALEKWRSGEAPEAAPGATGEGGPRRRRRRRRGGPGKDGAGGASGSGGPTPPPASEAV